MASSTGNGNGGGVAALGDSSVFMTSNAMQPQMNKFNRRDFRTLEVALGASIVATIVSSLLYWLLWYEPPAVAGFGPCGAVAACRFGACPHPKCQFGTCTNVGTSFKCSCLDGFASTRFVTDKPSTGGSCDFVRVRGAAFTNGALTDCAVFHDLNGDFKRQAAKENKATTGKDGSFELRLAHKDLLPAQGSTARTVRLFLDPQGTSSRCKNVATGLVPGSPLMTAFDWHVHQAVRPAAQAITPLSTLAVATWGLSAGSARSIASEQRMRKALGVAPGYADLAWSRTRRRLMGASRQRAVVAAELLRNGTLESVNAKGADASAAEGERMAGADAGGVASGYSLSDSQGDKLPYINCPVDCRVAYAAASVLYDVSAVLAEWLAAVQPYGRYDPNVQAGWKLAYQAIAADVVNSTQPFTLLAGQAGAAGAANAAPAPSNRSATFQTLKQLFQTAERFAGVGDAKAGKAMTVAKLYFMKVAGVLRPQVQHALLATGAAVGNAAPSANATATTPTGTNGLELIAQRMTVQNSKMITELKRLELLASATGKADISALRQFANASSVAQASRTLKLRDCPGVRCQPCCVHTLRGVAVSTGVWSSCRVSLVADATVFTTTGPDGRYSKKLARMFDPGQAVKLSAPTSVAPGAATCKNSADKLPPMAPMYSIAGASVISPFTTLQQSVKVDLLTDSGGMLQMTQRSDSLVNSFHFDTTAVAACRSQACLAILASMAALETTQWLIFTAMFSKAQFAIKGKVKQTTIKPSVETGKAATAMLRKWASLGYARSTAGSQDGRVLDESVAKAVATNATAVAVGDSSLQQADAPSAAMLGTVSAYAVKLNLFVGKQVYEAAGGVIQFNSGRGMNSNQAVLFITRYQAAIRLKVLPELFKAQQSAAAATALVQFTDRSVSTLTDKVDVNECISQPCSNGGECIDDDGKEAHIVTSAADVMEFYCVCADWCQDVSRAIPCFRGDRCQIQRMREFSWAFQLFWDSTFWVGIALVILPSLSGAYTVFHDVKNKAAAIAAPSKEAVEMASMGGDSLPGPEGQVADISTQLPPGTPADVPAPKSSKGQPFASPMYAM